ncbi:hypothetical protein EGR_11162 [Echinococcus granulosus]|uniref:Uncharacterized protein n=1 Tax=Echinococcus granulosus TaxID=6210 RepID=W6U0M5_ECHGR|nr:hypothetical protein EGR_11162 [Echinococcus granulosus]EUB53981.1 hypothetical protein EGR_11162 [Echinococcus granulosus]
MVTRCGIKLLASGYVNSRNIFNPKKHQNIGVSLNYFEINAMLKQELTFFPFFSPCMMEWHGKKTFASSVWWEWKNFVNMFQNASVAPIELVATLLTFKAGENPKFVHRRLKC